MSDSLPPSDQPYDLCIVGAGISGLCLARMASARHLRCLILDQQAEAGGCLCTAPIGPLDAPSGWLELGAHTCYNSYCTFLEIMAGTGFLDRAVPRRSMGFKFIEHGVLRSIPSCVNLWEAARSLPRMLREPKTGQTAAAYYGRVLGRKNWARVLHPMLNAVASQETADFPADALFKRRPRRRKDVLKSFAVRGGLGPAVQALGRLPGVQCALERQVTDLLRTDTGFQVRTSRGETFQARRLAVAVPPDAAQALLAAAFPEIAEQLGRIEVRLVRSLGVVFRDPLAHLPRLTGLILPEGPCFSAVSADTFPVPGKRAWTFHFDGRGELSEPAMLDYACQVAGATQAEVEASFRRDHRMPSIRMGHDAWLAGLDRSLAATDLMLAGNYLSGLSIEDCAGRARAEFERVLPAAQAG